jgi:tetratricopeptide (TPR) repeat protein
MDLAASLSIDQRRFQEAFRLLDATYQMHRAAGDLHAAGRTLISKGIATGHALDPEGAIRLLGEALRLIDTRRDPKLVLAAVQNLLSFLVEVGRLGEARRILEQSRPLYDVYAERLDRLKVRWLEGFMAAEQGDDATAETAYSDVRAGFSEAELPYDAALVSLDLAAVWLRNGRHREIAGMIDEMVAIFRARNIRREAIGALLMLREACERQGATAALLRTVTSELQRLEREPARR